MSNDRNTPRLNSDVSVFDVDASCRQCLDCGAPVERWQVIDGHQIYESEDCCHRMLLDFPDGSSNAAMYDESYFTGGKGGYADYRSAESGIRRRARRYTRLVERVGIDTGSMLEIGSAAGYTLDEFQSRGWRVSGVEANPALALESSRRFSVQILPGPVEEVQLPANQDLIVALQVIEHLRSPLNVLRRLSSSLNRAGHLLIETWSMGSQLARLLGKSWHQYSPPTVVHWFSARALVRLCRMAGFELVTTGRPLKFLTLRNGLELLRYKYPRLPDSVLRQVESSSLGILGVPYPPLDVFWAVFRKRLSD